MEAGARVWRNVEIAAAAESVDQSLVLADGLKVVDAAVSEVSGRSVVRVRQVTAAGDTITLVQGVPTPGDYAKATVVSRGTNRDGAFVTFAHHGRSVTVIAARASVVDTVLPLLSAGPPQQ